MKYGSAALNATAGRIVQVRMGVARALRSASPAAIVLLGTHFIHVTPALGGPEQGTVVRGVAEIRADAGVTRIDQATERAIIDWRSFSLGEHERIDFNQPSAAAATLNRVVGGQRSVIEGALTANGNVFLLNPSGILFADSAKVDVGGLVATTSNIANDDFMLGNLQFTANSVGDGSVVNLGSISIREGGMAALVSPSVRNDGVIAARAGRIALSAGEVFALDLYGDQMINFAVGAEIAGVQQSRDVTNAGSLIADGGRVLLSTDAASGVVGGVVSMPGVIQARSVEQLSTGEIVFSGGDAVVEIAGSLDASGMQPGTTGGSVSVTGQEVRLTSSARVDASGSDGGGEALIGGGFAGFTGPRASHTVIDAGAVVDVSAHDQGNAGKVAVWGTQDVGVAGTIVANGGAHGGDGGFVEISGKGAVNFNGALEAAAASGRGGTLLLDPADITIQPIGGSALTDATISGSAIRNLLRQGVTVQLLADNSITVNDFIDGRPLPSQDQSAASGAVEMTAGSILLLQPIVTNDAAIRIQATTGDISFSGNAYLAVANTASPEGVGTASVTLSAARDITATQIISLGRVDITSTGGNVRLLQALNGLQTNAGASGIGSLNVTAASGNASVAGVYSHGDVSIAAGGVTVDGPVVTDGSVDLKSTEAGGIVVNGVAGNATIDAGRGVTMAASSTIGLHTSVRSRDGDIVIGTAAGRVGAVTMDSGTALQSAASAAASDDQTHGISIFAAGPVNAYDLLAGSSGAVSIDSQGDVTLHQGLFGLRNGSEASGIGSLHINTSGASNVLMNGVKAADTVTIVAGASLRNASAALDSSGNITLATSGAVTLSAGVLSRGGNISIGSATQRVGALTLADLQSVTSGAAGQSGGISLYTSGSVSAQNLTAGRTGAVLIDSQGSVTLNTGVLGLCSDGAATCSASIAAGIGSLSIAAADGITTNGVKTAGDIALLTPADVTINAGLLTLGGDIEIGSASQRAANITLSDLQAVESATSTQAGSISIYSTEDVSAHGLLAGAAGTVRIDSLGSVALNEGLFGLCANGTSPCTGAGLGIGDLAITAAGDVTTLGVLANNSGTAIALNAGGTLRNTTAALQTRNGAVSLSGDAIELERIGTSATAAVLDAATDISVTSAGAIDIQGGLRSESTSGAIEIRSDGIGPNGSIATAGIATGTSGTVRIEGSSVLVAGSINDKDAAGNATDNTGTHGVGSVYIAGSDNVTVHGIRVSGTRGTVLPVAGDAGSKSVALLTDPLGSIDLLGPIHSGGAVFIGQTDPYQAGAVTGQLDAQGNPVPANAQVNLSNSITTTGDRVTVNGDLTLFESIGRWDIECALTGPENCLPDANRDFDVSLLVGSIFGASFGSGLSDTMTPQQAEWIAEACNPASTCHLQYRAPTLEEHAADFSSRTFTYVDIVCNVACSRQEVGGVTSIACIDCIKTTEIRVQYNDGRPDDYSLTEVPVTGSQIVTGYFGMPLFPQDQVPAFIKGDYVAVGSDGNPLPIYNLSHDPAGLPCSYYSCGAGVPYDTNRYISTDPAVRARNVALAHERRERLIRSAGVMTATIDTTAGSNPQGAPIVLNGNVGRYRGAQVTPSVQTSALSLLPGVASALVMPTFVSHALDLDAGTGGSITIQGNVGDDSTLTGLASLSDANFTGGPSLGGDLGLFNVSLRGANVTLAQQPDAWEAFTPSPPAGFYLTGFSVDAAQSNVTDFTPLEFVYFLGVTGQSFGAPGNNPRTYVDPTAASFAATAGAGSTGVASLLPQGSSGLTGISFADGGNVGSSASGAQGSSTRTGFVLGQSGSEAVMRPSTSENSERVDATKAAEADDAADERENDETCRRGPAQLADLGLLPAVDGAAPDVFSRCPEQ